MARTKIEWADRVWNPTTGCTHVSEGCRNCYAEAMSHRFGRTSKPWIAPHEAENVKEHRERLTIPLGWKAGGRCFVDSMSDLFHRRVSLDFIAAAWAVMALAPHVDFLILTKRPERYRAVLNDPAFYPAMLKHADYYRNPRPALHSLAISDPWKFPLANVWLGTSVESDDVEHRIGALLDTPAAVRFLSCEPLIGPLELLPYLRCDHPSSTGESGFEPGGSVFRIVWKCDACGELHRDEPTDVGGIVRHVTLKPGRLIDWVIVGGESGPAARPMAPCWLEAIVDDCHAAGVPVFVKQLGSAIAKKAGLKSYKGGDVDEWPAVLQPLAVREYPIGGR